MSLWNGLSFFILSIYQPEKRVKITIICFQNGCSYLFKLFTTRIRCYRSKKQTSQIDPTQLPPSLFEMCILGWNLKIALSRFDFCFYILFTHSHIIHTPQNDRVCVVRANVSYVSDTSRMPVWPSFIIICLSWNHSKCAMTYTNICTTNTTQLIVPIMYYVHTIWFKTCTLCLFLNLFLVLCILCNLKHTYMHQYCTEHKKISLSVCIILWPFLVLSKKNFSCPHTDNSWIFLCKHQASKKFLFLFVYFEEKMVSLDGWMPLTWWLDVFFNRKISIHIINRFTYCIITCFIWVKRYHFIIHWIVLVVFKRENPKTVLI